MANTQADTRQAERSFGRAVKRVVDVAVGSTLLVILAPLLALIALLT